MEEKRQIRELKSKHSLYCIWGKCPSCSRTVDGRGIHDVEVYQVFECQEDNKCCTCGGDGYKDEECPHCDGLGHIQERCEDCNGKGKVPDEFGEKKLIKEVGVLVKKK